VLVVTAFSGLMSFVRGPGSAFSPGSSALAAHVMLVSAFSTRAVGGLDTGDSKSGALLISACSGASFAIRIPNPTATSGAK